MPDSRQLHQHLRQCIIRFAGLHSWYKIRGPFTVCLVPVMGNVQEPESFRNFQQPMTYQPTDVLWHLEMDNRLVWRSIVVSEGLEQAIKEAVVVIPDGHDFSVCGLSKEITGPFEAILQDLERAAGKIIEFIEAHPEVSLPEYQMPECYNFF
jgi:hypothetical protein